MSRPSTNLYPYKNQDYEQLKSQHNSQNLFEDSVFPAVNKSIYYTKSPPRGVTWKRPHEICSNPQFIVDGASRFDLDQGYVGNCWFIAAAAMITQRQVIFEHVVPQEQNFDDGYAGIFHFRFWQFGHWYDVVVDDLLPVFPDGRIVFCSNKEEKNEFWSCLLEKAYAKLSWSYEGLDAGQTTDGLIDMSGGIEETFELKEVKNKAEYFSVLSNALVHDAMMGSSINADPNVTEARLSNGLVRGHAYSITAVHVTYLNGNAVPLIRLRNPWGNEVEWNGSWSDRDPAWNQISYEERQQLTQVSSADGEFWMSYDDWFSSFDQVQICNLSPDTLQTVGTGSKGVTWDCIQYDGEFIAGKNAGGCGQPDKQKFWLNPQYLVRLVRSENGSDECVLIVAFMQKYTRQKRMQMGGESAEEFVQLRIFRINDGADLSIFQSGEGQKMYPKDLERIGTTGSYINKREVTYQCRLKPGNYIIIPSTYEVNKEAKYLMRVYTEGSVETIPMNIDRPDVDPQELDFKDGKGEDPVPDIKQWWESLPADQRDRVKKMAGVAAVGAVALCCCIQIFSNILGRNDQEGEQQNKNQ